MVFREMEYCSYIQRGLLHGYSPCKKSMVSDNIDRGPSEALTGHDV